MKIIAFIIVYNEEEIIEKCIENAKEQGLEAIVIDNGCTDSTIEIVKSLGIPVYENKTEKYKIHEIFRWAIACVKKIGCDWYMLKDADEIFETYDRKITVREAVIKADKEGYNCMRFDLYEFWPTVDDDLSIKDFTERIRYYSYYSVDRASIIKNDPLFNVDIFTFPVGKGKLSPDRLILRHYKFINLEQGRRKVKSRLSRYDTKGLHAQYRNFTDESKFYVLEKNIFSKLHKFDGTWIRERVFDGWRGY